jgi:hypothetical protein
MKQITGIETVVDRMNRQPSIVVDVANIMFQGKGKRAKLANFLLVRCALEAECPGASIFYLADASTRYKVDDKDAFEELCEAGVILQTPAGEQADHYLLSYAERIPDCIVVSCDRFKEYELTEDMRGRIVPALIIGTQVIFSHKFTDIITTNRVSPTTA